MMGVSAQRKSVSLNIKMQVGWSDFLNSTISEKAEDM
jgi:hypothetical protein